MLAAAQKGKILVFLACLQWGVGYPIWKFVLIDLDIPQLLALCSPVAAVFLFCLFRMRVSELRAVWLQHWPQLLGVAFFGGLMGSVLIFYTLDNLDTGVASILEKLQPIFTILLARLFLSEHLTSRRILFGMAAIICSFCISLDDLRFSAIEEIHFVPVFTGIGSAVCYGVATVFARKAVLNGALPKHIAFFRMAIAGAGFLGYYLMNYEADSLLELSAANAVLVTLLILGPYTMAFYCYFSGLQYLKAGVANLFELSVPIIALVLGILIHNEQYSLLQLVMLPIFAFCLWQVSRGGEEYQQSE